MKLFDFLGGFIDYWINPLTLIIQNREWEFPKVFLLLLLTSQILSLASNHFQVVKSCMEQDKNIPDYIHVLKKKIIYTKSLIVYMNLSVSSAFGRRRIPWPKK